MAPLVAPELARARERKTRPVERAQAVVLLGLGWRLFEGCGWLKRNDDEERSHDYVRHRYARHRYVLVMLASGAAEGCRLRRRCEKCAARCDVVRWHCSLRLLMRLNVLLQHSSTPLTCLRLAIHASALQAASAKHKARML